MIETHVLDYLKSALDVEVCTEVVKKPQEYITIKKNGESGDRFTGRAMFLMKCHGKVKYRAAQICESLNEAMFRITEDVAHISAVELNTTGDSTDESIRDYCYQSIFEIVYNK